METEQNNETRFDAEQPSRISRASRQLPSAALILGVVVLSFLSGMAGSLIERRIAIRSGEAPASGVRSDGAGSGVGVVTDVSTEDKTLVDMVERSSGAVVSVVATKEVTDFRRSGTPFYFGPFGFGIGSNGTEPGDAASKPEKRKIGSGTGFFVSSDGLVVTNKHVVSDETADYTVVLSGGKEFPAKVLAQAPTRDIAVLKIDGDDFPFLPVGDSSSLRVGQSVIAIGNPLGEFPNSVSRGIISGLNRNVTAGSVLGQDEETLSDIIQTDAAINPGNSGGPLLDLAGTVIGINVAVAQGAENIGFAIPIDQVRRVIDEVKSTGKLSRPYIGVRYAMIDAGIAKENGLPYEYGALVVRGGKLTDLAVIPNAPADKAGIVENDIILEIDGNRLDTDHTLADAIADHRAGDTISLKVWHKGETRDLSMTLEERS